ncbi:MAG: hypothetical protein EA397_16515 [Deltaproteobacteria bacterium]|nr:MAG: hypothetical protein EA397_16515 [Deltaproteobacteria bacterium]
MAWLLGGTPAVVVLLLGTALVAGAGGLLALRVHLDRLPLALGPVAAEGRIDGHRALRFRVRLGRGRRMARVKGSVRYLPTRGEPIELPLLVEQERDVIGPWTLVVVDRADQISGAPGRFEVEVEASEGDRTWTARRAYGDELVVSGRFLPALSRKAGRIVLEHGTWAKVEPSGGETRGGSRG